MVGTNQVSRFLGVAAVSLALVVGCKDSGSSGGGAAPAASEGSVTVAVTDAASDEIDTFLVEVSSLKLQRATGAIVETLPQAVTVDFADLVSVSDVLAATTLPVGGYDRAYMTFDFDSAKARITGNATQATLLDSAGAALRGRKIVEIVFDASGFTVGANVGHYLLIDFDLDQSLTVDAAANEVKVDMVFYAEIDPSQIKPVRLAGLASSYGTSSFELDVRADLGLVSRGKLTVNGNSTTVYNLNGQVTTGQAGFDALKAKGDNYLVAAAGTVDPTSKTLAARWVVNLPTLDAVEGLVVARTGGLGQDATLTLKGVSVSRAGSLTFNDNVTLTTSFADTKVGKRRLGGTALTTDAINVGQRVLAYGTLSGSTLDISQPGAGFVRLVQTALNGAASAPPAAGKLTMEAIRIGGRRIAAFDFSVGGVAQLDTSAVVVDIGTLGVSTVASGTPIQARGFFPAVAAAPSTDPDFDAEVVIDRANSASILGLWWVPASTTPIASSTATSLTFDIAGTAIKHVDYGLIVPTLLTANPVVDGGAGLFVIRDNLKWTLYADYAKFKTALEAAITGGKRMRVFKGVGRYDAANNKFTSVRAVAVITT